MPRGRRRTGDQPTETSTTQQVSFLPGVRPTPVFAQVRIDRITGLDRGLDRITSYSEQEMIESVRRFGVLNPVTLRIHVERSTGVPQYEVVAGRRRIAAAVSVGLQDIPAMVFSAQTPPSVCSSISLVENSRRSPNPISELEAIEQLVSEGHSIQVIARELRLEPRMIRDRFQLRRLVSGWRQALRERRISLTQARQMARNPVRWQTTELERFRNTGSLRSVRWTADRDYEGVDRQQEVVSRAQAQGPAPVERISPLSSSEGFVADPTEDGRWLGVPGAIRILMARLYNFALDATGPRSNEDGFIRQTDQSIARPEATRWTVADVREFTVHMHDLGVVMTVPTDRLRWTLAVARGGAGRVRSDDPFFQVGQPFFELLSRAPDTAGPRWRSWVRDERERERERSGVEGPSPLAELTLQAERLREMVERDRELPREGWGAVVAHLSSALEDLPASPDDESDGMWQAIARALTLADRLSGAADPPVTELAVQV